MSITALIKSIFWGIIAWFIIMLIIALVVVSMLEYLGVPDSVIRIVFIALAVIILPACIWALYAKYKEESTCPRCKTPFVFYEKSVGSETLSEDYISQDVKGSDGVYRRKSYKVGKERNYYKSKCKECGFTKERQAVSNFKREV